MTIQGQKTETFAQVDTSGTFVCPSCHSPVVKSNDGWECSPEGIQFKNQDGIPSFILPWRRDLLESSLRNYQLIRTAEGWGMSNSEYYDSLPYKDLSKRHGGIWRIRARTYDCFLDHLFRHVNRPDARILDLGAGNGWLSCRLAARGFDLVPLDINLDRLDGLGALAKIPLQRRQSLSPVRAEFDALPFASGSFDVAIFNASLHYSGDIVRTLQQTLRILRPEGLLYILDSPIYRNAESGRMMIAEMEKKFKMMFGLEPSTGIAGHFLTFDQLDQLKQLSRLEFLKPWYGVRWMLRPLVASVMNNREPASFRIIVIHKPNEN